MTDNRNESDCNAKDKAKFNQLSKFLKLGFFFIFLN